LLHCCCGSVVSAPPILMCFIRACSALVLRITRKTGAYHIKERWHDVVHDILAPPPTDPHLTAVLPNHLNPW
jgi:hypothetical protein